MNVTLEDLLAFLDGADVGLGFTLPEMESFTSFDEF